MIKDRLDDFIGLFAREAQALQDFLRHLSAQFFVAIKMDASGGWVLGGRHRFGHVVEQHGPGHRRIGVGLQVLEHELEVVEHCPFRVIVRRLFAGDRGGQLGQHVFEQAALAQQLQPAPRVRRAKEFGQFFADALGADASNHRRGGLDGGERARLDLEIELGGQANGPEQPQVVLGESFAGQTDRAEPFGPQIGLAADPVAQLILHRVVKQAVDSEITAASVGLRVAEDQLARAPAILIIGLGPEGCDLELMIALNDDDDAEFPADSDSPREELLHLLG